MNNRPDISIITPSMNMLSHLKKCSASVGDQEGVAFEHIVIDGGSTDGTAQWLRQNPFIKSVSEKDQGMYDAINKGFRLAGGSIVAYLNCDEQYLPGTLKLVATYFEQHPELDIVFGDFLVIRPSGELIAYRKTGPPRWFFIASSYLYVFSCTMFLRRRVIDEGFLFDITFRAVADLDFVIRVLRHGYKTGYLKHYLSAYTMTGANMSITERALLEGKALENANPMWLRLLKHPLNMARLAEKVIHGSYQTNRPLEYSIYTSEDDVLRRTFRCSHPSFRWKPLQSESNSPHEDRNHEAHEKWVRFEGTDH